MNETSLIETFFPEIELSAESYKEKNSGSSQTLTGLGKWWGRKPLVLVRAVLLGCLLPATNDPKRDREIFLKLMTMDGSGLLRRKKSAVAVAQVIDALTAEEREEFFTEDAKGKWSWKEGLSRAQKKEIETKAFLRLPYEGRLRYCLRPEEIDGPGVEEWKEINAHLGTSASSLQELVEELGQRHFGRTPHVGDVFCGGGSIPFEAARLGCHVHASDLNPVACLLTWGALKLLDTSEAEAASLAQAQAELQKRVDEQITAWGIEHNSQGWRADTFLYCIEAPCPECGWKVPMAPSWVISQKQRVICTLISDAKRRAFTFQIGEAPSEEAFKQASKGTVGDKKMHCPHCRASIAISTLRGDRKGADGTENNLRRWEKCDFQPRPDDLYQERLYCIRWVVPGDKGGRPKRVYAAPTEEDLQREERVVELLSERFHAWQEAGFLPSRAIEPGDKTNEPIRTRGWTHWHHLFNPRQLLLNGVISRSIDKFDNFPLSIIQLNKVLDYSCKNCVWHITRDGVDHVFSDQSLKVLWNFGCKSIVNFLKLPNFQFQNAYSLADEVNVHDAKQVAQFLDLTITDPPYADAVNYDELSEFFLAWLEPHLKKHFPDWYCDSKRDLAVCEKGDSFNKSMIECYSNLTKLMPDYGIQVIMFNSTNVDTWNDFSHILWKSGLKATAFWSIVTESLAKVNKGSRLKTTSIFVCRKRLEVSVLKYYDDLLKKEIKSRLDELILHEKQQHIDMKSFCYSICVKILTEYNVEEDRKYFGKKIMDRSFEIFKEECKNKFQDLATMRSN